MGDQGAGGGIESHMPTHRRQDSGEEPIPSESAPETRSPPSESDPQDLSPPPQDLPRGSRELGQDGPEQTAPVANAAPGLSRNPSTCSTASNSKPNQHEYLTAHAQGPDRRLSPTTTPGSVTTNRPLEPPVTKTTLSELDVAKIVHNPRLRHDINFDPELHFRPNLDGEKGKRKQEKANQFWSTLLEQLLLFVTDRPAFHMRYGNGDWCLPSLLRTVREIIETLVPQRDRELLNEGLNVDLLMQQFNRGVVDLEKLASWLSGILKLHCAPMRDEWVDEMYRELSNGNRNNDLGELVKGMRSLLCVLEAMKLDVANHQIRCLRPMLIEDTVHFEQRFFIKKIESGKHSIATSRMWYKAAQEHAERLYAGSRMPYLHAFGEMAVFFEALSRLVLPSTSKDSIPWTFSFDEDRLLKLRSDMYDSICLEICMRKYEDLERLARVTQLCSKVPSYVRDEPTTSSRVSGDFNFMTPAASRPSSLALSENDSNLSSPRTSGVFFVQPATNSAQSGAKALELYDSLLALLHTAPPTHSPAKKWKSLADSMALQILRYANAPTSLPDFEKRLAAWLGDVHGDVFREVELHFQQRLLAELARRVSEFKNLSGVALFSLAAGGRLNNAWTRPHWDRARDQNPLIGGMGSRRDPREEAGIEDMAIRLAHIGILHWRVWAPLAYEGDIESELNSLRNLAPCHT
ncbi:hypothetical protein VTK56DRAFT_7948 [Thermocarpiscus australiensis]